MDSGKSILVLDDDPRACAYLGDLLRHAGFAVDVEHSCKTAIKRLGEKSYDAILTDQWPAGGCGESVIHWLKAHDRRDPLIVMSALADYDLWIDLVNKGAADLLSKPVQPNQLYRALQLAMGARFFNESGWPQTLGV